MGELAQRKHWNPARQPFPSGEFLLVVDLEGPLSADQQKQIRIRREAASFNMRT
jgi:hypothetical protein